MNSVVQMVSLSLSNAIITDGYYVQNVTAQRTSQYGHSLLCLSFSYVWFLSLINSINESPFRLMYTLLLQLLFPIVSNIYSFKTILISPGNGINCGLPAMV